MDRRSFLAAAAAAPFALRSPVARSRLVGGTPLALVTADLEAHVVAVELVSGKVLTRLRTLPGPRSIESVGGSAAVVAHRTQGLVSVIDGPSLRVRSVIDGFREPRYTAAAAGARFAYVTDSGGGEITVIDVVGGQVLGRLELGGPARHVSLNPSGRQLWVVLGPKAETVAVIEVRDGVRLRLLARLRPPFLAHDVGFAPDGRSVWVTSGDRGAIAVYDVRTHRIRLSIAADAPPQHVTFIAELAYVASGDDGTLRVYDLADGRLLRTTRIPVGSYNVQQGWGVVMTPSLERGTLCVLGRDGGLEHELRVARSSHDACFVMSR